MMAELDILNGFVGKIISDCIDISINAIRKADKNRKSQNQTIETRIYQVTIDALNTFPYNKYKKKDQVYDAAECILKELKKGNSDYKESVRLGLNMISLGVTGDKCEEFLGLLNGEICREENRDLAIGHIIHQGERISEQQQQMGRHMQEGFEENNQNHEETHRKLNYLIEKENGKEMQDAKYSTKRPIENRVDEYAKRWDKNVFLNNFNKRDKDAGVNIKLQEIYPEENLPHYKWKSDDEESADLKELLKEYIVDNNDKKMLLILGQPGIGKSTLITWIMANLVEEKENILVYQFASDLRSVNWQDDNILDEIFVTIDLGYNMLEGKTLILDGFDEIYVKEDREKFLYKMNQELKWKNLLKTFSIIITCRENYVDKLKLGGIEHITLQAWDEGQIRSFCETYEKVIIGKDSTRISKNLEIGIKRIIEKKDIMGIPLILYMVLALNVDVERSSSTVDIYDQVFSLRSGGIYDRGYDAEHRINNPKIKKHVHHISQRIAFWIFENNAGEATIPQEKFEEICNHEMQESEQKGDSIQRDILIGNFFKIKHCEGKETDEIQFAHRSIYEYFVVLYFFESIYSVTSKEEVAGKLGELLKDGHLSKQILEYVRYKFSSMKGCDLSDITREVFKIMLRYGMTYYFIKEQKTPLLNIIDREMRIFSNMLEIVHLWNLSLEKVDNKIASYLRFNRENSLNLSGADLSRADLSRAKLSGAKLSGAKLSGADLRGANLYGADLREADLEGTYLSGADLREADLRGAGLRKADLGGTYLSGADLREADLREVDLSGADLREADLREADLFGVNLREADLRETIFDESQTNGFYNKYNLNDSRIYILEAKRFISYEEYCIGKQKM